MDDHVCRLPQVARIRVAGALVAPAYLQDERARPRELEDLIVVDRLEQRELALLVVAADPDVIRVVHVDAVLTLRPLVPFALAAPRLDEIACRVELHHRWCRLRQLVGGQRTRPMQDPHVIAPVDGDAGHVASFHFAGTFSQPASSWKTGTRWPCARTSSGAASG